MSGGRKLSVAVTASLVLAVASVLAFRASVPRAVCSGVRTRLDTVADCGACGVRCAADHASASCIAGRCQLACAEGFADCDGHPGNGCEAALRADRMHCGACTKSCGGALCEGGLCVARLMGSGAVVAADAHAVWSVAKTVTRYPLDGGDPSELPLADAPAVVRATGAGTRRVRDATHVYWIEDEPGGGGVVRWSLADGGELATLVAHPARIRTLAQNDTHVFWSDARDRIFMAPKRARPTSPPPTTAR